MDFIKQNLGKVLIVILALILAILAFFGYKITQKALEELKTSHVIHTSHAVKDPFVQENEILSKNEIEEIVRNYIVSHPEVIVQSLEDLQQSKMKEQNEKVALKIKEKRTELEDSTLAPSAGNLQGDVTVIAFIDYNCGYCKKANKALNDLINSDVGVKVVYQLYPILGEGSEYIAKVALAVRNLVPEKFLLVHNRLMQEKINSKEDIIKILEESELKFDEVQKIMDSQEIKNVLERSGSLANYIGITGVPAVIIGDQFHPGFVEIEHLKQIIDEIRAAKINNNTAKSEN